MLKKLFTIACLLVFITSCSNPRLRNLEELKDDAYKAVDKLKEFNLTQDKEIDNNYQIKYRTDDENILRKNIEGRVQSDLKAKYILDNWNNLSENEKLIVGNDPDTIDFIYNCINDIKDEEDYPGVSKDFGRKTPYFCQWDNRWAYNRLASSNIGIAGCGPTSMAMVLSRLSGDLSITPDVIANDASNYMGEYGISWKFFEDEANKYGYNVTYIGKTKEELIGALDKGPVLLSVSRGYFTINGHILVLDSYRDGKFYINDPNNYATSAKEWDYDEFQDQIVQAFSVH